MNRNMGRSVTTVKRTVEDGRLVRETLLVHEDSQPFVKRDGNSVRIGYMQPDGPSRSILFSLEFASIVLRGLVEAGVALPHDRPGVGE